jgi:glycosyltransferase involved in cell wall biosynthesis
VHNEARILTKNAATLCRYLEALEVKFEVILVDNGSTDDTLQKARALAGKLQEVKVFSIPFKSLGAALRLGFEKACGAVILWYPMDLAVGLSYIKNTLAEIDSCDVIVGSKAHSDSVVERRLVRRALSRIYNRAVNLLFGLGLSDTQCVKTYKRESILPLLRETQSGRLVFEVELLYRARQKGLAIREYPVVVTLTRIGSRIRPKDIMCTLFDLLKLRLRLSAKT